VPEGRNETVKRSRTNLAGIGPKAKKTLLARTPSEPRYRAGRRTPITSCLEGSRALAFHALSTSRGDRHRAGNVIGVDLYPIRRLPHVYPFLVGRGGEPNVSSRGQRPHYQVIATVRSFAEGLPDASTYGRRPSFALASPHARSRVLGPHNQSSATLRRSITTTSSTKPCCWPASSQGSGSSSTLVVAVTAQLTMTKSKKEVRRLSAPSRRGAS